MENKSDYKVKNYKDKNFYNTNRRMSLSMPFKIHSELEKVAAKKGLKPGTYIRTLIMEDLDKAKQQKT